MRGLIVLSLGLSLVACSVPLSGKIAQRQAQHQFIAALDEFSATNRVALLEQLQEDYPDGAWSARAETVILHAQKLDDHKRQVENLHKEKLQLERELSQLRTVNQQLQEKLEKLKSVLIEREQRPQ